MSAIFITVDQKDRRPVYQQVADGIKGLIANGSLQEGETLPPVRQLAADLGVNLNTVAAAYRELQSEGLINIKHGSGAVIASRTAAGLSEEQLRRPLRTALTQLILAGLPRRRIMSIVADEMRLIMKGSK